MSDHTPDPAADASSPRAGEVFIDVPDGALAEALTGPLPGEDGTEHDARYTLRELAEHTGLSLAVLEAIEREGLLIPRAGDDEARYSEADARAVRAGMALLDAGLPLGELLDLARRYDGAMRGVADHAVDLFVRFVRDPVQANSGSEEEAAMQLVAAFQQMLPATSDLIAHHFRRLLLLRAQARLEEELGPEREP